MHQPRSIRPDINDASLRSQMSLERSVAVRPHRFASELQAFELRLLSAHHEISTDHNEPDDQGPPLQDTTRTPLANTYEAPEIRVVARAAYAKHVPRIGREPAPMMADYEADVPKHRVVVLEVLKTFPHT